jgi:hypothetical protein
MNSGLCYLREETEVCATQHSDLLSAGNCGAFSGNRNSALGF